VALPLRAVLDTNVVVSGLLRRPGSASSRVLDAVASGLIQLLLDERILAEYAEVLVRPRLRLNRSLVAAYLDLVASGAESVAAEQLDLQLPDPDDLMFLEVAVSGGADYLVTDNGSHFVPVRDSHHISVLTPRQCADLL
jgi:putative PIN family toxin of toxin-antitoxin system